MKALRLIEVNHFLQMQDVPMPTVDESDVLVSIKVSAICRSDLHYRAGKSPV